VNKLRKVKREDESYQKNNTEIPKYNIQKFRNTGTAEELNFQKRYPLLGKP
jgi:hypothetical protein